MPSDTTTSEHIVRSLKPDFEYPDVPIAQYIAEQLKNYDLNVAAVIDPTTNAQLTYGELDQQAQCFASALLNLGATRTDLVLFFAENSTQYVIALLGTVYLGLTFCPVPPTSGPYELTEQISGSGGSILVFGTDKLDTIRKACDGVKYSATMGRLKVLVQLEADQDLFKHPVLSKAKVESFESLLNLAQQSTLATIPHFPITNLKQAHFCLCYTSGTTGPPKAAIHSQRSFLAMLVNAQMGPKGQGEHVLQWHPIGHMSGMFMSLYSVHAGKSVVLHRSGQLEQLLESVVKYKLAHLTISANHASQMISTDYRKVYDLSSLAFISHSGSKVAPAVVHALMERYSVICLDYYGSTECMMAIGDRNWTNFMVNFEVGNLGTVWPNVQMKIADLDTGRGLGPGEHGEICVRSEGVFIGYLNNEEATRATIDADGWLHSGDIGYVNESGELFFVDRIKEMIKYRLYSIFPAEIENFLHTHPAVEAVCVVGVPNPEEGGELVRAYVQLKKDYTNVTETELIAFVAENMGDQKRLRGGVRFVKQMARTMIGKVDRQWCKELVKEEVAGGIRM